MFQKASFHLSLQYRLKFILHLLYLFFAWLILSLICFSNSFVSRFSSQDFLVLPINTVGIKNFLVSVFFFDSSYHLPFTHFTLHGSLPFQYLMLLLEYWQFLVFVSFFILWFLIPLGVEDMSVSTKYLAIFWICWVFSRLHFCR